MPWSQVPYTPVPDQNVFTAADIIDYIVAKAVSDGAFNLLQINTLANKCRTNTPPAYPGDDAGHCRKLQRARFFADAGDWIRVATELDHGHV